MADTHHEFRTQSDRDLLATLAALAAAERQATARVIGALAEVDARRLYLGEGCSSMFTYCTQVLHLSEHAAYARIEAARAARAWPMILELIADGSLHLTAITLLGRHLTAENHQALLAAARHKTKREIEAIVAALRPQPAMPPTVRKLPAPRESSATRGSRDTLLAAALPVPVARLDQNVDRRCAPAPPTRPPPSRRSRQTDTRFSSRSRAPRTTRCAGSKTSCGTDCLTAMSRRSSIAR